MPAAAVAAAACGGAGHEHADGGGHGGGHGGGAGDDAGGRSVAGLAAAAAVAVASAAPGRRAADLAVAAVVAVALAAALAAAAVAAAGRARRQRRHPVGSGGRRRRRRRRPGRRHLQQRRPVTLVNDTFTANSATGGAGGTGPTSPAAVGSGYGGAVFAVNGTLNATYVTFSANIAQDGTSHTTPLDGTDIYVMSDVSDPGVHGSQQHDDPDRRHPGPGHGHDQRFRRQAISGGTMPVMSGSHDLISNNMPVDGTVSPAPTGSRAPVLISGNPLLSALGSYGGDTQTMALLPGSPAIDAGIAADDPGTMTAITTDQRGIARPQGTAYDIGSFESRGFTITVTAGNNQTRHRPPRLPTPSRSRSPALMTSRSKGAS